MVADSHLMDRRTWRISAQQLRTFTTNSLYGMTAVGDALYFATLWSSAQSEGERAGEGEDPSEGCDLWRHVPGNSVEHLAHFDRILELTNYQDSLYFVESSRFGSRLGHVVEDGIDWVTDPSDPIWRLTAVDTTLYFTVWDADNNAVRLYQYSGAEPILLAPLGEDVEALISALDRLFIVTQAADSKPALWVWQASQQRAVRLVSAPTDGQLTDFTEVDGHLYFARGDASGSLEWWVTDGTPTGTRPAVISGAAVAIDVDLLSAEGDGAVSRLDVEADEGAVAAGLHFSPALPDKSGIASLGYDWSTQGTAGAR